MPVPLEAMQKFMSNRVQADPLRENYGAGVISPKRTGYELVAEAFIATLSTFFIASRLHILCEFNSDSQRGVSDFFKVMDSGRAVVVCLGPCESCSP